MRAHEMAPDRTFLVREFKKKVKTEK